MQGNPEGTGGVRRRIPRAWLLLAAVFVAYLGFRLIQGLVWLIQQL